MIQTDLLSGFIGALIGSLISAIVSWLILRRQLYFESNRFFVSELIQILQKIYTAQLSQKEIGDDYLEQVDAFKVLSFKEFDSLHNDLEKLKDAILQYREGRTKSLQSTSASAEEVQARQKIEAQCKIIIKKLRKLT